MSPKAYGTSFRLAQDSLLVICQQKKSPSVTSFTSSTNTEISHKYRSSRLTDLCNICRPMTACEHLFRSKEQQFVDGKCIWKSQNHRRITEEETKAADGQDPQTGGAVIPITTTIMSTGSHSATSETNLPGVTTALDQDHHRQIDIENEMPTVREVLPAIRDMMAASDRLHIALLLSKMI